MLGDCLMIRSTFTLVLYYVLMAISFGLIYLSLFKVIWAANEYLWLVTTCEVLFVVSLILNGYVAMSDPGRLKKDESLDFMDLLD